MSCSRKRIVEAVILSVLDYRDVIHAAASTLRALDPVYYSSLVFINGDHYSTHHYIFYDKVSWLPHLDGIIVGTYLSSKRLL